ncbi:hypothetical protein ABW20_dc0104405 [Dactylellina cionopaga]|nr:hypothetical protein ABW20_dc0104405 [Dactylellina cionopaga]
MKSTSLLAITALVATATSIPVEGEGGIVVQGGNANTRLGLFYKPIKNILEEASAEEQAEGNKESEDTVGEAEVSGIIAEQLPEQGHEETIMIVEATPTPLDLIMPGLMNLITPQQVSPPSPVEEAFEAVEELIEQLQQSGVPDDTEIDLE